MKIYTKTGDQGQTGLYGGGRLSKAHQRVQALGEVDELNAHLGWLADVLAAAGLSYPWLADIQAELFTLGAQVATERADKRRQLPAWPPQWVAVLEGHIDALDAQLPAMTHFILPGGHALVSQCHVARAVCRRAERSLVALAEREPLESEVIVYINRLSDLLFVLARHLAQSLGVPERKWLP